MTAEDSDRTPLRWLVKGAFSLGAFLVALLLAEIVLSVGSWIVYPRLSETDPDVGWRYRPTGKTVHRRFSSTISYDIFINGQGFRDDEFLGGEAVRIMVLGDSMTF